MIDETKLIEEICNTACIVPKFETDELLNAFLLGLNAKQICVMDLIANQPKVGEWIPVEERLPKQDKLLQDYLVTFEYYRYGEYNCMYKTIGIGTFDNLNHKFTFINSQTGWRDLKVLSWQPLPEPFEVKENE